jgi:hypothetical protein
MVVFGLNPHQPFGLSLSKARHLCSGPFDKLRVNGVEVFGLNHHPPFGLSLSKARHLGIEEQAHAPVHQQNAPFPTPFHPTPA